jgi:hypothetical protein
MDAHHQRIRTPAAADYIGYSVSTLEKKRLTGDGPPFYRLSRTIVYDTRDLDEWLAGHRARSTSNLDSISERCEYTPPASPAEQTSLGRKSRPQKSTIDAEIEAGRLPPYEWRGRIVIAEADAAALTEVQPLAVGATNNEEKIDA